MKQGHKQESVAGLAEAVVSLTEQWMDNNRVEPEEGSDQPGAKIKPQRVIYYRDGVSHSELAVMLDEEYTALKKAFESLSINPKITFVVAQKKHHTRFFPANPRHDGDKNGNIKAGTVIDHGVTLSYGFDFYLSSHQALQGTTRPCHYHVLLDENSFSPDDIHILTFSLCFLYCRATKSVSLVPPVYYAHLAAFRGRTLLQVGDSASEASSGQGAEVEFELGHEDLRNCMFWV